MVEWIETYVLLASVNIEALCGMCPNIIVLISSLPKEGLVIVKVAYIKGHR